MADPISPDQFKEQVLDSDIPVLIDFFATWCGPCRMMAPVIEEIAKEQEGKIKVMQFDVDENGSLAQACGVVSVPTFVAIKDGKMARFVSLCLCSHAKGETMLVLSGVGTGVIGRLDRALAYLTRAICNTACSGRNPRTSGP